MMLPADLVETAPDYLKKKNFTETVRFALKDVLHRQACRELLAMRGKINFGMTWQELKELRD